MPRKPKPTLPRLEMLDELLVLGGRYRFSRGQTKLGRPLLYVSAQGARGGVTVLLDNLQAFYRKFGEVVEKLGDEASGEGTMQPAEEREDPKETVEPKEEETTLTDPCLGPLCVPWLTINRIEGGLESAPELFEPHEFKQEKDKTACGTCTFDAESMETYVASAEALEDAEVVVPDKRPSRKRKERSPLNP